MIRVRVATVSGAVHLMVHDKSVALERVPRVYTIRERVGRWAHGPKYAIRGLGPGQLAVTYHVLGDRIRIETAAGTTDVAIRLTKSAPFSIDGRRVRLRIFPLRGRLVLETMDGEKIARGTYGLTGVEFAHYERALEPFLAAFAVGFALREAWSEAMWVPMAVA